MAFRRVPKVFRSSRARRIGGEGYTRIARGWYLRTAELDRATSVYQKENLIVAARIAAFAASTPSPIVIRGRAAAFLQGLPCLHFLDDIEFSGEVGQGRRKPFGKSGMTVTWREGELGQLRTVTHKGMRIASLEQIIEDAAVYSSGEEAVVIMSGALRTLTDAGRLRRGDMRIAKREREIKRRVLKRIAERHGRRRQRRARRLIALASALHESPAESRLRWFFAYWGFPCPREQVRAGRRYIDFGFELWRIAVEFDGYAKLATNATDLGRMLRRDEELNAAGWRVLHVTWDDFDAPEALARRLAEAFPARAGVRLGPRRRYL